MSEYRRAKIEGGTYFFTVNTYRRQPILTIDLIRRALREGINQVRRTLPFKIEAWVLLPDHLHCIWALPPEDANFSARWAIIKRHVSKCCTTQRIGAWDAPYASRRIRKESGIWQRRFWEHLIRNDVDFRRHVDYIHWNPVKHGHVRRVSDWPYSTFHRFVKNGFYPPDWGGDGIDVPDEAGFGE